MFDILRMKCAAFFLVLSVSFLGCRTADSTAAFEQHQRAASAEIDRRYEERMRGSGARVILSKPDWCRKYHPKLARARLLHPVTRERLDQQYADYVSRIRYLNDQDIAALARAEARVDAQTRRSVAESLEQIADALARIVALEEDPLE